MLSKDSAVDWQLSSEATTVKMPQQEMQIFSHQGPWNESTRSVPSLAFLEAYTNNVKACNFGGPYHDWFTASAMYYNMDGKVYDGGEAIWDWMRGELFGPFERIGEDEQRVARVLRGAATVRPGVGVVDECGLHTSEQELQPGDKKADLIFYEQVIIFYLKQLPGEGIPVRRLMEWVISDSEVEGQGWKGSQIWKGKVWWDRTPLGQEIAARRAAKGASS